jgi:hypothetical protein
MNQRTSVRLPRAAISIAAVVHATGMACTFLHIITLDAEASWHGFANGTASKSSAFMSSSLVERKLARSHDPRDAVMCARAAAALGAQVPCKALRRASTYPGLSNKRRVVIYTSDSYMGHRLRPGHHHRSTRASGRNLHDYCNPNARTLEYNRWLVVHVTGQCKSRLFSDSRVRLTMELHSRNWRTLQPRQAEHGSRQASLKDGSRHVRQWRSWRSAHYTELEGICCLVFRQRYHSQIVERLNCVLT